MIKAKTARKLSEYSCSCKGIDVLLDSIEKYIKDSCSEHKTEMGFIIDGAEYDAKISKKVIKILKHNGYKVTAEPLKPIQPNYPTHIILNIKWWW